VAWILVALRRLRHDRSASAGVAVLVLATALVAALAPRIVAHLADEAVRGEVTAAHAAARNILVLQHRVLGDGPPGDPLAAVRDAGARLLDTFPAGVREDVSARDAYVETGRFRLQVPTTDPAFVRFRIQEGVDAHIQYVQGRAPTPAIARRDDVGPEHLDGIPVYETGISAATATRFGLVLDQVVPLVGDPGDQLFARTEHDPWAFARITGIYEVPSPDDDFWLDDALPVHPVIRALSSEVQLLDAVLLVDPATHADLAEYARGIARSLRYGWRFFLDPAIHASEVPVLTTAFRRLAVLYPSPGITPSSDTAMRTGMLSLLGGFTTHWNAAVAILAVTAVGPGLVALATMGLIAVLAAGRRRSTLALARSRGASAAQVLLPTLIEGLLVAGPAAAAGVVLAMVLVADGGRARPSVLLGAGVVAVAVAVLLGTMLPVARSLGTVAGAAARRVGRPSGRRLLLEGLVVALAVGSAMLLRQRGLGAAAAAAGASGAGAQAAGAAFDPLIAAVPALVGAAAGILAMRLLPLPMWVAASVARRLRGLVPMLAARRAGEGAAAPVLLVLLATATVGTFGAVAVDDLDRGADLAAWNTTGAAYRVTSPAGALPRSFDATALPGVEASASVFTASMALNVSGPQVLFVAVDANALGAVLAGTPVAQAYPEGFADPGTGPIPAIVSRVATESDRGVTPGEPFQLSVEGYTLAYRTAAIVDSYPGLPSDRAFVIVSREWFKAQAPQARIVPTAALLRAPPAAAAGIRDAVAAQAPTLVVTSQAEDAEARRSAPVTGAVRSLILAAALLTALYAALGVAAALALAGSARAAEVAQLRTLGLTSRQGLALAAGEHGPTTLVAFLAGAGLGAALFALLRPALGIGDLVGAPVDVPVVLEPAVLLLILAAMTAVVATGLLLGAVLGRRVAPIAALRGRSE
jgi:putative ABC transport system permease protein